MHTTGAAALFDFYKSLFQDVGCSKRSIGSAEQNHDRAYYYQVQ